MYQQVVKEEIVFANFNILEQILENGKVESWDRSENI